MKIILLYGGMSAEHDISIISAHNILQSVMYDYYDVQPIYITREGKWLRGGLLKSPTDFSDQLILESAQLETWAEVEESFSTGVEISPGSIQEDDAIVFPVLHGPNGEDGTIQGFLEVLNMPYVGAGVTASACGMDKIISKHLFDEAEIPQVPFVSFNQNMWRNHTEEWVQKCEGSLIYPFYVKPANMGSSVGISRVENQEELKVAVEEALNYDSRILVEQGIIATECEVAVLGNADPNVSVVGQLIKETDFYNYEEKYINNRVEMKIPADLPEEVTQKIQDYALRAYRVLDGCGLSRVDFFVTQSQDVYINEVNTMPGFTQFSMYPLLWEATGLERRDLIEELLQLALKRHKAKQSLSHE